MPTIQQAEPARRTTWTVAALCKVLDDPESTPADVMAAMDWNAVSRPAGMGWLKGWDAGRKANGAPPAEVDRTH